MNQTLNELPTEEKPCAYCKTVVFSNEMKCPKCDYPQNGDKKAKLAFVNQLNKDKEAVARIEMKNKYHLGGFVFLGVAAIPGALLADSFVWSLYGFDNLALFLAIGSVLFLFNVVLGLVSWYQKIPAIPAMIVLGGVNLILWGFSSIFIYLPVIFTDFEDVSLKIVWPLVLLIGFCFSGLYKAYELYDIRNIKEKLALNAKVSEKMANYIDKKANRFQPEDN